MMESQKFLSALNFLSRNIKKIGGEDEQQKYIKILKTMSSKYDVLTREKFNDIPHKLKYIPGYHLDKFVLHIGQRKLFLSELQFLTRINKPGENATVVYAGAAPGNHTWFLSKFFPHLKFILVDPAVFRIHLLVGNQMIEHTRMSSSKSNILDITKEYKQGLKDDKLTKYIQNKFIADNTPYNILIIRDLFTNELASSFGDLKSTIYFISDIRTNEKNKDPSDLDVIWNSSQQYNWLNIIQPQYSLFKFRHPYYEVNLISDFKEKYKYNIYQKTFELSKKYGIDFVKNYLDQKLIYSKGDVYIQAWPGQISTESRLFVEKENIQSQKDYGNYKEYESCYYYYNSIDRGFVTHHNSYTNPQIGFDKCNDCSLEALLWESYFIKHHNMGNHPKNLSHHVQKSVNDLIHITRRPLKRNGHGYLYNPIDSKWLQSQLLYSRQKSDYLNWVTEEKIIMSSQDKRNLIYTLYQKQFGRKKYFNSGNLHILFSLYDKYFFNKQIFDQLQKLGIGLKWEYISRMAAECKIQKDNDSTYTIQISQNLIDILCVKQKSKVQKDLNIKNINNTLCLFYTFEHQLGHLMMILWDKLDTSKPKIFGHHGKLFYCLIKNLFGY